MKAVVMNGIGGRDMLEYVERPDPVAGPGEALVEIAFAGVNFMDIGIRQGMAWTELANPKILGVEGAGRVLAVGDGVEDTARRRARRLGRTRPEAMRSGSRSQPRRWSRSPTPSTTASPHPS